VPLVEREVPIVGDEHVDPDVGTGALKVTPGHDPNDLEIGRRHGLEEIAVIGFDGRMTPAAGERYAGLTADAAHERVVADLRERGLLREEQPWRHSVGHCSRSGNRVEPLVSLQWFCDMQELAAPAIAAVHEGRVRFVPKSRERIFFDWMEQIRPWCVSRQLWWGHQLPVWYCSCGETIVQASPPVHCPPAARATCSATRTCSTPGSRRRCHSRRSAGRRRRRATARSTPGTRSSRRATSSTSGSRGW
jgi:valyl-tRNA synthetase